MVDGKIVPDLEYGRHIALACKNHPALRWSTKNIAFIGARSIFYNLMNRLEHGEECDCPASALYATGKYSEDDN